MSYFYESSKLRALRAHVPTCLAFLRAHVPFVLTCQRALRAYVPMYLACLGAHVPCVPKCSRAIASNNKNKFSMTCFTYIFDSFFVFFLRNKTFRRT